MRMPCTDRSDSRTSHLMREVRYLWSTGCTGYSWSFSSPRSKPRYLLCMIWVHPSHCTAASESAGAIDSEKCAPFAVTSRYNQMLWIGERKERILRCSPIKTNTRKEYAHG